MPYRVDLVRYFFHPKTGKRLSEDAAKRYNRRAKRRVRPQLWLVTRIVVGDTRGFPSQAVERLKKTAGRIAYAARLTTVEKIIPLSSFADRKVRQTLANHRVYQQLWDDFEIPNDMQRRGGIRITVNGRVDGRRVRETIHLPFHRQVWEERSGRDAKEYFKEWLVGSILSNLRRRGVRLSNPIESRRRIASLTKNRAGMLQAMEFETDTHKRQEWLDRIKWATDAIRQQKKSRQLRGATLRIEKLV